MSDSNDDKKGYFQQTGKAINNFTDSIKKDTVNFINKKTSNKDTDDNTESYTDTSEDDMDKDLNEKQNAIMKLLDWSYDKTVNGLPGQKTVDELVDDYISKYDSDKAIDLLIKNQTTKAATSGFLTGLGGIVTLPVALPANITTVILFQMRMIAAIAKIRGYDLKDDQVQTFVYVALTGTTVVDIAKKSGIVFVNKLSLSMINKIPGTVLTKINQAVGFRFITKAGSKGIVNLGKMVPVAGGLIGGTIDTAATLRIGKMAKRTFTEYGIDIGEGQIIDIKVQEANA